MSEPVIDFQNLEIHTPCQSEDDHVWVESNGIDGYYCSNCGRLQS